MLALAVPPFHLMERGFYKSSAAIFVGAAALIALGDAYLIAVSPPVAQISTGATVAWWVFLAAFSGYFASLFFDYPFLTARLFPIGVLSGLIALAWTGAYLAPDVVGGIGTIPYILAPLVGAAAIGSATSGMLLGHWYLIDVDLELDPLLKMHRYCRTTLLLEIFVVLAGIALLCLVAGQGLSGGFSEAFGEAQGILVLARVAAWALGVLLLVLIDRTLQIPQTMAATGLFYIQATCVAVGEILAHWLLFRTQLPF